MIRGRTKISMSSGSRSSVVTRLCRWNDEEVEKGFIQGVLLCCKALAHKEPDIPRRYIKALRRSASDPSVIVTQADKGGGVVIMDIDDYTDKMNDLLQDSETHEEKPSGCADKIRKKFDQETRQVPAQEIPEREKCYLSARRGACSSTDARPLEIAQDECYRCDR